MTKEKSDKLTTSEHRSHGPFEEMERLFEDLYPRNWFVRPHFDWPDFSSMRKRLDERAPKVDVIDRENEIVVRAEVPGVKKDDLEVTATEDRLTIKGKTEHEEKEEKGDYFRHEISKGSFSRTVALPCDIDSNSIKANFKDGVLEIVANKTTPSKRTQVKID